MGFLGMKRFVLPMPLFLSPCEATDVFEVKSLKGQTATGAAIRRVEGM